MMKHILLALCFTAAAFAAPKSFSVAVQGTGTPVILIPGLASSPATWDSTVANYKTQYQFHLVHIAGFAGKAPVEPLSLENVRKELATYIRDNKLDHPVIIGHSLGGFLALWLASVEPELTGKLVIVDSLPFLPAAMDPAITVEGAKMFAAPMRDGMLKEGSGSSNDWLKTMATKPEDIALLSTWSAKSDRAAVANAMYELYTTDLRSELAKIKVPVKVLGTWIAYQQYASRASVEKNFQTQFAKLSGVEIMLFDTARHFIMFDDPTGFFAQLDSFLPTSKAAVHE